MKNNNISSIGIIGAGKMGSWFAVKLAQLGFKIHVYDIDEIKADQLAKDNDLDLCRDLITCLNNSDLIILAVPISATKHILKEILNMIENSKGLRVKAIIDIASFKKDHIQIYSKYPKSVTVGSIHPMFGPGKKHIKNSQVIVIEVPNRESDSQSIARFLKNLGFKIVYMDPETHDKIMGAVLGIPHSLSVILAKLFGKKLCEYIDNSGTLFKYLATFILASSNIEPNLTTEIIMQKDTIEYLKIFRKLIDEIIDAAENSMYLELIESRIDLQKKIIDLYGSNIFYDILYENIEEQQKEFKKYCRHGNNDELSVALNNEDFSSR